MGETKNQEPKKRVSVTDRDVQTKKTSGLHSNPLVLPWNTSNMSKTTFGTFPKKSTKSTAAAATVFTAPGFCIAGGRPGFYMAFRPVLRRCLRSPHREMHWIHRVRWIPGIPLASWRGRKWRVSSWNGKQYIYIYTYIARYMSQYVTIRYYKLVKNRKPKKLYSGFSRT